MILPSRSLYSCRWRSKRVGLLTIFLEAQRIPQEKCPKANLCLQNGSCSAESVMLTQGGPRADLTDHIQDNSKGGHCLEWVLKIFRHKRYFWLTFRENIILFSLFSFSFTQNSSAKVCLLHSVPIIHVCRGGFQHTHVHTSIIHNSQKMEQSKYPSTWMDKRNVIYTHTGMLFSLKKEGNTDTCYNMDKPWRHYAKWNKPVTKRQILHDSICMVYLK